MAVTQITNMKPAVGVTELYFYEVEDSATAYTAKGDVYKVDEVVNVAWNDNISSTAHYASDKKKLIVSSKNPNGSIGLSGNSPIVDEKMLGRKAEGGAMLDTLNTINVGIFYAITLADNQWMIRQLLKVNATKAESSVDTKTDSVSFQTQTINIEGLASDKFGCYIREFYSTDEVFTNMTLAQVLEALATNPAATFPVAGG